MANEEYAPMHPGKQLAYLFLAFIACYFFLDFILSGMVIYAIYGYSTMIHVLQFSSDGSADYLNAFRIFLALGNTIIPFLAPSLFFSYLIVREPGQYLKTTSPVDRTTLILVVLVLAIMLGFSPLIELLGNINAQLKLPPPFTGLQHRIEVMEQEAEKITAFALDMKTSGDLIISLLIIGILPAICEEFFFRGCLQTVLKQSTRNTHAAVWITAFIFSFIHFEFFGFLPRLLLGGVLGYFVAWSGNIWLSVWGHFVNNGTAVVLLYLFQHHLGKINPNDSHLFNNSIYLFSTIITVILLLAYQKIARAKLLLLQDEDD